MNNKLINQVKKAREYSYLGMYNEAETNYKDAIISAKEKYQEKKKMKDQKLFDMYHKLYSQIKKERNQNLNLIFIIENAKLPQKPQVVEKKEIKLPYNQMPFQFHHDYQRTHSNDDYNMKIHQIKPNINNSIDYKQKPKHQVQKSRFGNEAPPNFHYNPQNNPQYNPQFNPPQYNPQYDPQYDPQYKSQYNQQYNPPQYNPPYNPDQDFDSSYNDGYNNKFAPNRLKSFPNNNSKQAPYKDPMVWEPLSPKKGLKKPAKRKNSKIKPKREYEKQWLVNDAKKENKNDKKKEKGKEEDDKSKFVYSIYPDGIGPDSDLIEGIETNLMTKNPNVTFDNIAGLENAKESLKLSILCPLLMKEYFKNIRKPPKGILLYGPAGTGKTMLAKAIATTGKTSFFSVNPASLASKWKGESEKLVKYLFEMARFYAPTTIFIDEIDSLLSERSQNEHEASRKVKVQFFIEIDGVTSSDEESQPKVFILAATNRPWDLDEAILRRLSKRIYIPLPNEEARKKLFEIKLSNVKLSQDIDLKYLVAQTDMYNSDDIEGVCRDAALAPFKRRMQNFDNESTQFFENLEKELLTEEITMQDFKNALNNVKSSASVKFLKQYEEWTEKHSSV